MNVLDRRVPAELLIHVVFDNLSVHRREKVLRWLRGHPRFVFHFVPSSSSWMNMVEGWLGRLPQPALTLGIFRCVPEPV